VKTAARLGLVVALMAVPALLAIACGADTKALQAGEACFAATDCAPGLVCVPQRGGASVCSNDLTQVTGKPPAEAGAAEAGDAQTDGPRVDGEVPDTGTDTGVDTGIVDAGDAG